MASDTETDGAIVSPQVNMCRCHARVLRDVVQGLQGTKVDGGLDVAGVASNPGAEVYQAPSASLPYSGFPVPSEGSSSRDSHRPPAEEPSTLRQ